MKSETKALISGVALTAAIVLVGSCIQARAQDPTPQNPGASPQTQTQTQTQANQASKPPDPLSQLGLTPDQIKKIRGINAELRDQRQAANLRLIQAQQALAAAIESPTPDENIISQRSHEVADAQATMIRIRSLTEARVLQVLTAEQRVKLKEIRQQNQALRRANQQNPQNGNGLNQRQPGNQRNVNSMAPIKPNQRKPGRQQRR